MTQNFEQSLDVVSGSGIVSDPLTSGVSTLAYAAAAQVAGGTPIFFGEERKVLVAYEEGIPPIPIPAAFWLFGTVLIGLIGYGNRRNAT